MGEYSFPVHIARCTWCQIKGDESKKPVVEVGTNENICEEHAEKIIQEIRRFKLGYTMDIDWG